MNTDKEQRRRVIPDEKVLTPQEVEGLETQIADHEQDRKESEKFYDATKEYGSNNSDTDPTIRRYKRVLQRGKPGSVGKAEFLKRERQMKIDREWLQGNMVPKKFAALKAGTDPDFRKSVNFMAKREMSAEFQQVAQRYKNNARLLHPDSPEVSNLETIRPESN